VIAVIGAEVASVYVKHINKYPNQNQETADIPENQ
jgi:hypothetical protein